MIVFLKKGVTSTSALADTSAQATFSNETNNFHHKAILLRTWCNFCENSHDENTCEIKKSARDHIFGKIDDTNIVS